MMPELTDEIYENLVAGKENFTVDKDAVFSPLKEATKEKFSNTALLVSAELLPDVFVETCMEVELTIVQDIGVIGGKDSSKKLETACFVTDDFKDADKTKKLIARSLEKLAGRMEFREYVEDMPYEKFREGMPDFLGLNRFSSVEIPIPEEIAQKIAKGYNNSNDNGAYYASLYLFEDGGRISGIMRDKAASSNFTYFLDSPKVYDRYKAFFRQARGEKLIEALLSIGADALMDKMQNVFSYKDISVFIDTMIDNGLLHAEMVDGKEKIAVYRAATQDSPEGWYLSNYNKVVDELMHDEEGVRYCLEKLEEKCRDLKEHDDHDIEEERL